MTLLGGIFFLFFLAALVVALWHVHFALGVLAGGWILALLWYSRYSSSGGFRRPRYERRYCDPIERDRWA